MTKNKPPKNIKDSKKPFNKETKNSEQSQEAHAKIKLQKEKLELLQFPCDFPIKVFSNSGFNLEEFATSVVHKHSPNMEFIPATTHSSSKGNYLSVTVVVKATSKEQIDSIYKDLVANKNIIMAL